MKSTACYRLLLLVMPLGLLPAGRVAAQTPQSFRVDHLGVSDGLTQGSVYYMHKDSRGFMWFGTQDGLNRYDGHRFWPYRPTPTLPGEPVRDGTIRGVNIFGIVEDPAGRLWVGTEEGLNRYDPLTDTFRCVQPAGSDGRPRPGRTLPFYADARELLYLSDVEGLVSFDYRQRRKRILNASLQPPKEYDLQSSTVRTPAGDVWLHAPTGLIRYNLRERKSYYYFSSHPDNRIGTARAVFSFYIDARDIAWIGTDTGLIRYNHRTNVVQTFTHLPNHPTGPVYSIAEDNKGRIWLGTQRNGVLYYDRQRTQFGQVNEFTNDYPELTNFEINKIYVDNQGIIWANADPDGLAKIVPDAFLFDGVVKRNRSDEPAGQPLLSNYVIRGFLEVPTPRGPQLWIATEDGINVLDRRTNQFVGRYLSNVQRSNMPMQRFVRSLYRDAQGRIWVGVVGGILLFRPETGTFEPFLFERSRASLVAANYVRNIISLDANTLLTATEDGAYLFDIRARRWLAVPDLQGINLFSLGWEPARRRVWLGTYLHGVLGFDLPANPYDVARWTRVQQVLNGFTVLHLYDDPVRRLLWLSTDRGLAALNRRVGTNPTIRLYTTRDGLVNPFVYGVLADGQHMLWLSTNHGLSRFDPDTETFKNFDLTDGLQGYEFNGNALYKTGDGELFFGGVNGFNRFRPERYRLSPSNPAVYIYNLKVNEEPLAGKPYVVGQDDRLDLTYGQNTLALEFAALDFTSNGRNTYQYRLMGYDRDWVQAGEKNYVRYANLPPGEYTFQVKTANKDGYWSDNVRTLLIQIRPPFWRTVPFVLLAGLLISLVVFGLVYRRITLIRRKQTERLRLSFDIQEQVKGEIARDLHDEIGTRLATLKLYASRLAQLVSDTPDTRPLKDHMFSLINDTIGDVRNLLRKLKPQTLEQYGYVAALEELIGRVNATGSVQAHLTLDHDAGDLDDRLPADTELMLYRITQELLNNTLKHAKARRVTILIRVQEGWLTLQYTDDGNGFDYDRARQQASGRGLGIGNIESRVAMLGGQISWKTGDGNGTRVTIALPIYRANGRKAAGARSESPVRL